MTETIQIQGMTCGGCVESVRKVLSRLPIEKAEVEVGRVRVEYDDSRVSRDNIVAVIQAAGFQVTGPAR